MKYYQQIFGLSCVALFAMFFAASGAFAQVSHFYAAVDGTATSGCATASNPCTLAAGIAAATGDTLLVQVRRQGGTATISDDITIENISVTFGTYQRSGSTPVSGILNFTGTVELSTNSETETAELKTHAPSTTVRTTVHLSEIELSGNGTHIVDQLTVSRDITVYAAPPTTGFTRDSKGRMLVVNELVVNSGNTLTVGDRSGGNRIAHLRVPLKKGADKDDRRDDLIVNGKINGTGAVYIAHENTNAGRGGLTDEFFHEAEEYDVSDKVNWEDCVWIDGSGTIQNELRVIAAGNVCVDLSEIGSVVAVGSINENDGGFNRGPTQEEITTDLFFTSAVEVDGDVTQWNDARIVFIDPVGIDGSVILREGQHPFDASLFGGTRSDDGTTALQDDGGNIEDELRHSAVEGTTVNDNFYGTSCSDGSNTFNYLEAVVFRGEARIADDIHVRGTLFDNCDPAVIFYAFVNPTAPKEDIEYMTRIGGDLLVEDTRNETIRVYLRDWTGPIRPAVQRSKHGTNYRRVHSLSIDGDIYASGHRTIFMPEPAVSLIGGESVSVSGYDFDSMCSTNDVSLTVGNRIVLTEGKGHVITSEGTRALYLSTLVVHDDLEVEGNGLHVTTLHIGEGGTLEEGEAEVSVRGYAFFPGRSADSQPIYYGTTDSRYPNSGTNGGALILQGGGLDGSPLNLLPPANNGTQLKKVVYASRSTDLVPGSIFRTSAADRVDMAIHLDRAELRLDEVTHVNVLGLCSGTVVLHEAGTEKDSTLYVHTRIDVADGSIEKDVNDPGGIATDLAKDGSDEDGYILQYVGAGERTAGPEWFAPRTISVNHKDAVIILDREASIPAFLDIKSGHVHLKGGDLTVGEFRDKGAFRRIEDEDRHLRVLNGELHTNGNNVIVHGYVDIGDFSRVKPPEAMIKTDGGNLHVLGTDEDADGGNELYDDAKKKGHYEHRSAYVIVGENAVIDLGTGTLQLGPEFTVKKNGLHTDWEQTKIDERGRPVAFLNLYQDSKKTKVGAVKGRIHIPKGSKQTQLQGEKFDMIVFDGTANPKASGTADNWNGTLYFGDGDNDLNLYSKVVVDSLVAMNGAVEFGVNAADAATATAEITKDVALSSAQIYADHLKSIKFKNLAISGTGGFASRQSAMVMIEGDFSIETAQKKAIDANNPQGGASLSAGTDMTVMGDFKASGAGDASRFGSDIMTDLHLKKGFDFGLTTKGYVLNANLEFSGKEKQSVSTAAIDLHHVEINGAGIMLESDVSQAGGATLTLSKGHIGGDGFAWTVKNMNIEKGLVGRLNAAEGSRCGEDGDEACAPHAIRKGSRNSLISASSGRHVMYGNDGGGAAQGGYLFPLGMMKESATYYRPIILQLPVDLSDTTAVTASLMSIPAGATPAWPSGGLLVQGDGGNMLTLDVYSPDLFWKVDLGKGDPLPTNLNVRVAAHGIVNVFDSKGLRVVQWACDWTNPRLAGRYDAAEAGTFAVNGYVGGVLNITQSAVDVETCSIFGIAANGIENPIHQESFDSGIARIQIVHNAQLPAPVNVSLDGVGIENGMVFQSATGYLRVAAGVHTAGLQIVGAPADQAIEVKLPALTNGKSYALVAHGNLANLKTKLLETRLASLASAKVDVLLVHGSADLGTVRLQTIDILADPRTANPTRLLASGFGFDAASPYRQLDPDFHRIEVISGGDKVGVFDVDLSGYAGETLILNLSDMKANLSFYGVDINGATVSAVMVTGTESDITELPTEFALHGNYPNPFNPSTRIQFDLPESAQVTVQIVDMLGREVMALPAKEFEAGANRSIELNATNLASGTYLYRMIATGAESRYVKSGRMTLVK